MLIELSILVRNKKWLQLQKWILSFFAQYINQDNKDHGEVQPQHLITLVWNVVTDGPS